jgi:hypothetical protein
MLARWSAKIAAAAPAVKPTTSHEAPKRRAKSGRAAVDSNDATDV